MVCSRCKKRTAVVFITRLEGEKTINDGICLVCAKELGIKPVDEFLDKFGITDEDMEQMDQQLGELMNPEDDGEEGFTPGGAATFPFLQNIFGNIQGTPMNDEKKTTAGDTNPKKEKGSAQKKKKRKFIDTYCTDLTAKANNGEMDIIVGREREIYRVVQILSRRTKNNPCLIGEPGVGKTAIAEGLALRISQGNVPHRLLNKEIHLLDLTALVAGTQFRGQFESRIKGLVDEVKSEGNIVLFIDEVHNLVGTGDAEGSMSAANILKPALSRGEIQVIGATTFNEYRKHIEKDAALERRFQPVTVEEPTIDEAIKMLRGIKSYYEEFHGVRIDDSLIRRAVSLSERYIFDRFLPDKAIDLLDEACASAALRNKAADEYAFLNRQSEELKQAEEAELGQETVDYEKLAVTRAELLKIEKQAEEIRVQATEAPVTGDDLAAVIELWTGIPAAKVRENELSRLANLSEKLMKKVIGQNEAVELVAAAIRRSRVQISARRRPASFIFVGPTGVGKTELVKVLATELFDTPETLIRLDMSEFMEKHSVSRIIGSPPGYIGYDEAGQLTEKVRRKPYSVILFDEIEKAHPDVLNILLQILDEGRVTDAHGRSVNFENTVIVMTSNAGSQNRESLMGFGKTDAQASKDKAMKALNDFLRPEFISRVDEVVYFSPLTKEDFGRISSLMLGELVEPLSERNICFSWTDGAAAALAGKAYGGKRGARDLRRVIRRDVEDRIASVLVERCEDLPKEISVDADGETAVKVNIK
ncbi:MAG: ATP-dependent Clp protease ATP-binding subunit [Oscillospiraceae bacterium]|nr:ATP-dependent Clp protease ATP-binding subunit [Oscillospiraceae bacterium]MDD4546868.1 ATP-dependent Clp protease ATP-binding subunit [Oscillospiraceae bacterium]